MTDRIDLGNEPWKALPRRLLRDHRLSPRAKGGLVTLLSHEEGWVRSAIGTLMKESDCGRAQAKAIMAELREAGYATLITAKEAGKFSSSYVIRAVAETSSSAASTGRSQRSVLQSTGNQSTGIHPPEVEPQDVEPQDVEPKSEELAPSTARASADLIFEILFTLDTGGLPYTAENRATLTDSAAGSINAAAQQIRRTGCPPSRLIAAIHAWPSVMGDATCTANAVAKHLPRLVAASQGRVARGRDISPQERDDLEVLDRMRQRKEAAGAHR